jgi:cephalosporin hydroxylase
MTSELENLKKLESIKNTYGTEEIRDRVGKDYAAWFYCSFVWHGMKYSGIPILKSPQDIWNYQEILSERKPSLVVEFGTFHGGATLFFANVMQNLGNPYRVLTVDPFEYVTSPTVRNHPNIEMMRDKSVSDNVKNRILELREEFPGQLFIILDGDHRASNVFNELMMIRDILKKDDYVIIEDSNLNGRPVPISIGGPGPWEAYDQYKSHFPNDYVQDLAREKKFGWTLATDGYLIKT